MERPPFDETTQLNTQLLISTKVASSDASALAIERMPKNRKDGSRIIRSSLPGQPRITLRDPSIGQYLEQELLTPDLDALAPHLWLVAKQSSSHISALHHQIVRGRAIIVTENPQLHLVWIYNRVYAKPIPKYLLSYAFWHFYLGSESSPLVKERRKLVASAARGFLRTYAYLIQHKSDFLLAKRENHRLVPDGITYAEFSRFIVQFGQLDDADVSARYAFGDLRLTRLNFWAKIFLRRFTFQKVYGQYGAYFARFYGPILFIFAVFSVALNAMQVALAGEQLPDIKGTWMDFTQVTHWFSICTLVCVAIITLFLVSLLLTLSLREICYAATDLFQKRRKKVLEQADAQADSTVA